VRGVSGQGGGRDRRATRCLTPSVMAYKKDILTMPFDLKTRTKRPHIFLNPTPMLCRGFS
jgi:hypothetical protein